MKRIYFGLGLVFIFFIFSRTVFVNAAPDTNGPTIKKFDVGSNKATASSIVEITVTVSDDISGVRDVQVRYYNPSKTKMYFVDLINSSGEVWKGTLEIDQYAEEGVFTLWEIICSDVAGNYTDLYNEKLPKEYTKKTITVINKGGSDTTPPEIVDYKVMFDKVAAPTKVDLELKLKDDNSGVSYAQISYYNPSKKKQYTAYFETETDGIWHGRLELDEWVEIGTYTLWEIIVFDKAGNYLDLYNDKLPEEYAKKTITVISENEVEKYGKPSFKWSKDKESCIATINVNGKNIKMPANVICSYTPATIFNKGFYTYSASIGDYSESQKYYFEEKLDAYVELAETTVSLKVGKKHTLEAAFYEYGDSVKKWKSSDKKIVTVNKKGKITAKKKGTAIITVTMKSGATATCKVTVK